MADAERDVTIVSVGCPRSLFFSLHFFKARQWTLCNDPLGPEVATPNASAVNPSGSDAAARCQRFRLRRGDLLYVPPGWPQMLAHCDTGNQSIEAKTSQNYDMLAIEKMSLPRWVAIFSKIFFELASGLWHGATAGAALSAHLTLTLQPLTMQELLLAGSPGGSLSGLPTGCS